MSETKKQILEIQIYIQYQIDKHLLPRVGMLKVEFWKVNPFIASVYLQVQTVLAKTMFG